MSAANCARQIFVVGAYLGSNKPNNFSDFLQPFIREAREIGGYQFGGTPVAVSIRCIVCDAPARNACLANKSYTGYYGCGRCCQKGVHTSTHGVTFPQIDAEKRTDASFRAQTQPEHHHSVSPFAELDIDMVKQFPLDYLHTVLLGVVKKMLFTFYGGVTRTNKLGKLPWYDKQKIADRLKQISATQPSEFQRKCRPWSKLADFKGTEFRTMILYLVPVVTYDILPSDQYQNMLLLHVAVLILVDPKLCNSAEDVAQQLLESFVVSFGEIYGEDNIVYNVHSLVHIVDDVKMYGSLDNYSAFPFESHMFRIKRMVLKHSQELQQVCNRVEESYLLHKPTAIRQEATIFKKPTRINMKRVFTEIIFADFRINTSIRNRWFFTSEGEIFKFKYYDDETKKVAARKVMNKREFYCTPISSAKFNIFRSDGTLSDSVFLPIENVMWKAFAIPLDNTIVFAPLRHSM